MSRVEAGVLAATVAVSPFGVHALYKLREPSFLDEAKVQTCLPNLPEAGIMKVGKLAVDCEGFLGEFPRVVIRNGKTQAYKPEVNPIRAGATELPRPGREGVTSVSFTLTSQNKFLKDVREAAITYKDDHSFIHDIFGGVALTGIIYGAVKATAPKRKNSADSSKSRNKELVSL